MSDQVSALFLLSVAWSFAIKRALAVASRDSTLRDRMVANWAEKGIINELGELHKTATPKTTDREVGKLCNEAWDAVLEFFTSGRGEAS